MNLTLNNPQKLKGHQRNQTKPNIIIILYKIFPTNTNDLQTDLFNKLLVWPLQVRVNMKESLQVNPSIVKNLCTEPKPKINTYIFRKWQELLSSCTDYILHQLTPTIGVKSPNRKTSRRDEVVIARLRVGLTLVTYSYLLKVEEAPICIPRQEPC